MSNSSSSPPDSARPHGPAYYGRGNYGSGAMYGSGAYGSVLPYYGDSQGGGTEPAAEASFLGPLSISRAIRVVTQKWPTIVVSVLLGLGVGFAYYKVAPISFRATSIIEIQVMPATILTGAGAIHNDPNTQGSLQEILNTRLAMLQSRGVVKQTIQRFRTDFPKLKFISDDELTQTIVSRVKFDLQRNSRLVHISAEHGSPEISQAIAAAYAATAEEFSKQQNLATAEKSVEYLKAELEQSGLRLKMANEELLAFNVENKINSLTIERDALNATYLSLVQTKTAIETEEQTAQDILSVLEGILQNPKAMDSLPDGIPRAAELLTVRTALMNAVTAYETLRTKYTDKHEKVKECKIIVDNLTAQLSGTIFSSKETAQANLNLRRKAADDMRARISGLEKEIEERGIRISEAQSALAQLQLNQQIAAQNYQAVFNRMNEVRSAADAASSTIRVIEPPRLPERQVSPDPRLAFSLGPMLGLIFGFVFVLVLDRIEDHITSTEDIERHMGAKVLALLPRVPRVTRNQLVSLAADKKFSSFSEACAGLRGLLESPRFSNITKVILVVSTQPEEGKTVTSSNLALTYAMSGKKTLLVDFDLRRPRIARMFGKADELSDDTSLLRVLYENTTDSFDHLPIKSGYTNLDIIGTRATSQISPANVVGSEAIPRFFEWARKNYEHIVVDSPPFGLVSDALALSVLSDSVIIVCRPKRSRYGVVRHCLHSLSEAGARVMGLVVNDVDFGGSGDFSTYKYNSYGYGKYGYGGKYKRYGYGGKYYSHIRENDDNNDVADNNYDDDERDNNDVADNNYDDDDDKTERTVSGAPRQRHGGAAESGLDVDDD